VKKVIEMPKRITTIQQLKRESRKGGEFFILLNGYMRSTKWIRWDDEQKVFHVRNLIDETRQKLTEARIESHDYTNIGLAIRKGAFFKDDI